MSWSAEDLVHQQQIMSCSVVGFYAYSSAQASALPYAKQCLDPPKPQAALSQ